MNVVLNSVTVSSWYSSGTYSGLANATGVASEFRD